MKIINLLSAVLGLTFFVFSATVSIVASANTVCEKSESLKYLEQRDSIKYRGEIQRDFAGRISNYKVNAKTDIQFIYERNSSTPLAIRLNGGDSMSLSSMLSQANNPSNSGNDEKATMQVVSAQEKIATSHDAEEQHDGVSVYQCITPMSVSRIEKRLEVDVAYQDCVSDCQINLSIDIAICFANAPGVGGCVGGAFGSYGRCKSSCGG